MTLIDEHTRECLAIRVARRINGFGVIETFADVMLERGIEVPPLKWSILRYGFSKEDHDGKKETYG